MNPTRDAPLAAEGAPLVIAPVVIAPLVIAPLVMAPLVIEPLVIEPLVIEPLVIEPVPRPRFTRGLTRTTQRILGIAIAISLAIHLVVLAALLIGRTGRSRQQPPPGQATVALVMEKAPDVQYGGTPKQGTPTPRPAPPPQPAASAASPPPAPKSPPPPTGTAPVVPMPPPPSPPQAARAAKASPPAAPAAPAGVPMPEPADNDSEAEVNLGRDETFQTGLAMGPGVVPAKPDARFNRPPRYPAEARQRSEGGAVTLLIHVTPAGTPSGVDVTGSSGYAVLDRAAREAVLRWRFNPEQKDGIPVASELPFRIIFDLHDQ